MRTPNRFRLTPKALLLALISACYPLAALSATAGKVEFSVGNVNAVGTDGRSRPLAKGEEINIGDTIQTGDGRAQVRFSDGGFISLTPNTEFKVNEYNFSGKADGTEKGFFGLVKGGLRAITGAIGHVNKKTYLVNTPVATIGIRGTEFLATMDDKLIVSVGDGAVYVTNDSGDLVLYKGQSGQVDGPDSAPHYTNDEAMVNAAGPSGGTPFALQYEYRLQQPDQATYVAGLDTLPSGISCELVGGCVSTSTSNIAYLAANNVTQSYSVNSGSVSGSFVANFGSGAINNFTLSAPRGFVSGATGTMSGISFSVSSASASYAASFGSFKATGSFIGPNAAQAGVSYTFFNASSSTTGSVVFSK
jgi:predicted RNA-binding protein with TRAM domain